MILSNLKYSYDDRQCNSVTGVDISKCNIKYSLNLIQLVAM